MTSPKLRLASDTRAFIDAFSNKLETDNLPGFVSALNSIETGDVQRGPLKKLQHPTLNYLSQLSGQVTDPGIGNAILSLDWGQVYAGDAIDLTLAEGMFGAQAAGTYGVFSANTVSCGLFLLAPGVCYPAHTHAAREVYYCLAGTVEITHGLNESSFTLSANQSSETPPGRLHALQTRSSPVLLAYVWTGDISEPTWWWEQDDEEIWHRTAWRRKPGESWKVDCRERVSDSDFSAALK